MLSKVELERRAQIGFARSEKSSAGLLGAVRSLLSKIEIVLANGRRVIVPTSVDPGGFGAPATGAGERKIAFLEGVTVWIAGGATDTRGGMNSLALKVQQGLGRDPHAGEDLLLPGSEGRSAGLPGARRRADLVSYEGVQAEGGALQGTHTSRLSR